MTTKTIAHLRGLLFDQLDALVDPEKTVDLERARLVCDTSQQIINTAKVEVEYAKVIGAGITLPFIEYQEGAVERPAPPAPAKQTSNDDAPHVFPTPEERQTQSLEAGPSASHPWRGLTHRPQR